MPKLFPDKCPECRDIFSYYNQLSGRKCKVVGDAARYAHARHGEYSVDHCKAVMRFKYNEWRSNPKMAKCDILTYFRISNFDRYLNQMLTAELDKARADLPDGDYEG